MGALCPWQDSGCRRQRNALKTSWDDKGPEHTASAALGKLVLRASMSFRHRLLVAFTPRSLATVNSSGEPLRYAVGDKSRPQRTAHHEALSGIEGSSSKSKVSSFQISTFRTSSLGTMVISLLISSVPSSISTSQSPSTLYTVEPMPIHRIEQAALPTLGSSAPIADIRSSWLTIRM